MICHRCLLRAARRNLPTPSSSPTTGTRLISTTTTTRAQTTRTVDAGTTTTTLARPHDLPAATSTPSAAQPFSTPLSPNARDHEDEPHGPSNAEKEVKKRQRTPSSVPAGTVLKGLNFVKGKEDPVAREDGEYPDWLWGVLRRKQEEVGGLGEREGDLFSKSKKQRRKAAKALRKKEMMEQNAEQKVPMFEQSVDLAGGEQRQELTGAMRKERRRKIKEDNFLRAMG